MKLFIDDERFPPHYPKDLSWNVVRTYEAAVLFMTEWGCPHFISFDHDLKDPSPLKSGKAIANWMVERDLDMKGQFIPKDFQFYVHSQNVNGKENILGLLTPYLKQRDL